MCVRLDEFDTDCRQWGLIRNYDCAPIKFQTSDLPIHHHTNIHSFQYICYFVLVLEI